MTTTTLYGILAAVTYVLGLVLLSVTSYVEAPAILFITGTLSLLAALVFSLLLVARVSQPRF